MLTLENADDRPLYRQISDGLRQRIVNRVLIGGEKLPSDQEMCEMLNVSITTVKGAYQQLMREGYIVRKSGPGGGTFVAKKLPQPRSFTTSRDIGIIFYDILSTADLYVNKVLSGVSEVADERGYLIHLFSAKERSIRNANDLLKEAINRQVITGLLLLTPWEDEEVIALQNTGCPFVMVDYDNINLDVPSVLVDDAQAARMATEQLIADGHKKIVLVVSKRHPICPSVRRRADKMTEGYLETVRRKGLDYERVILLQHRPGHTGIDDLVPELDDCLRDATAIIAQGDGMVDGIMEFLQARGKRAGDDIEIFAYASTRRGSHTKTLQMPLLEMGRCAANMLIDQVRGLAVERRRVLPVQWPKPESAGPNLTDLMDFPAGRG